MKKPVLITLLCAILLLITPLTIVAQENKISNNLSEKPEINSLIEQIKNVTDEILQKYGHIPNIANQCEKIQNTLDSIGNIIYCFLLILFLIPFFIILAIFLFMDIYHYTLNEIVINIGYTFVEYCLTDNWEDSKLIYHFIIPNLNKNCPCLQD